MRISDWSSAVCSSDLFKPFGVSLGFTPTVLEDGLINLVVAPEVSSIDPSASVVINGLTIPGLQTRRAKTTLELRDGQSFAIAGRSEEHTSELQSLMRISYAVFCLQKKHIRTTPS